MIQVDELRFTELVDIDLHRLPQSFSHLHKINQKIPVTGLFGKYNARASAASVSQQANDRINLRAFSQFPPALPRRALPILVQA